mmetsp:Transcript_47873/g.55148  ORF Transcript_47873/g.55148 Transcript_47873/m.55148 type:complete len:254 (+) Transcript_47873:1-762(+)
MCILDSIKTFFYCKLLVPFCFSIEKRGKTMCILDRLQSVLSQENRSLQCSTTSIPYKWKPIKSDRCSSPKCPEMVAIFNSFVDYVYVNTKVSLQENQEAVIIERHYPEEFEMFTELRRVIKHSLLKDSDKITLINLPSRATICRFLGNLAQIGNIYQETMVSALILLKRFLEISGWSLRATTWRPLIITSVRIAQKLESRLHLTGKNLNRTYLLFESYEFARLDAVFLRILDYSTFMSLEEYVRELKIMIPDL